MFTDHVARGWYETEYGQVEDAERWYHPAMIALERFAAGLPMFPDRKDLLNECSSKKCITD